MSDYVSPITVANLVAASEGNEGAMLAILRDATEQIRDRLRQRVLSAVEALGVPMENVTGLLDGREPEPAQKPAPGRKPAEKPMAPADDAELVKLLLVELDKGAPLSAKALARRTGAPAERVTRVLRQAQDRELLEASVPADNRIKLHGLKWSRKAAT